MRWTYGVTTVPERASDLLPRTLRSLAAGGFDQPRLFVDGAEFGITGSAYQTTCRNPRIRAYGSWFLGMLELYLRDPHADRYAMFQDDLVCIRSMRQYLEACPYSSRDRFYWNLYTFPQNQQLCPKDADGKDLIGWYRANQCGLGAVGLVFSNDACRALLTRAHMVQRAGGPPERAYRAIDGAVVEALARNGAPNDAEKFFELVHNPCLIQHTGDRSTTDNDRHPQAVSFPGEDFDAMELLKGARAVGASERWNVFDQRGQLQFRIDLLPGGAARKSHAPGVKGIWTNGADCDIIDIKWEDGWLDRIGRGFKRGWAPGANRDGQPTNAERAARV